MPVEFKLDPTLINALVERWRSETHTFHLLCGECTITLEDVQLQLSLLVDGSTVTEPVIIVISMVPATIFTSPSRLPLYFPTCNKSDPRIQNCIPSELLVNLNIWDVKVSLIVYSTVEMHESYRVMRQIGFRQTIPLPP
ncbi:hypothetical protein Golax_009319 [Gossypium laxum]|uniref:Aminotransferase-like plant mobile domain-containing protein n=1 Tax=Gossypium laxum TaxID=34288 RepID=A0A7J9ACT2_9ROSI|nr:hypothetical protein [Gossypium laxum]